MLPALRTLRPAAAGPLLLLLSASAAGGQQRDTASVTLEPLVVTATRTPRTVFRIPAPATIADSTTIRQTLPDGIADLFRATPGLDVTGVGPNQTRLSIRGQRGQRILLLEDGLRMNNSRRQQDFGEIPALIDPNGLARVEVIRGPSSVLYGTDAIGGVVNLIPTAPTPGGHRLHGSASYRWSSHDRQQKPSAEVNGAAGRLGFSASASYRDAESYEAPAGTFGEITLPQDSRVQQSGVRDQNYTGQATIDLGGGHAVFGKYSRYEADDAGFGFVDGRDLGDNSGTRIAITYPSQDVDRVTAGWRATRLGTGVADRLAVTGYATSNVRRFHLDVFIPFTPTAGLTSQLRNFTDLDTKGARVEAAKTLGGRHVLTYGVDWFRDVSENSDTTTNTITGFGPPMVTRSTTPQVPNASFRSVGLFAQGDLAVTRRLNAVLGVRYQDIRAATRETPGVTDPLVTSDDATVVASANLSWAVAETVTLIGTVGRGFRAPNLVERFFNGPTPEGSGFQERNPDLAPETSLNVDLGIRVRHGRVMLEGFVFRNTIRDGIRIEPTGRRQGPLPVFRNVNVAKIRDQGIEMLAEVTLGSGFSVGGSWARLDSDNVLEEHNPVGDSYSSKAAFEARWRDRSGRVWASWGLRHNGERSDVLLANNLLGDRFPSFTVQTIRGGARLFTTGRVEHGVTFAVENLTNTLYAEFSNAAFFRPEPKRALVVAWRSGW